MYADEPALRPAASPPSRPGVPLDPRRLWRALRRRLRLFAVLAAAGAVAGVVVARTRVPRVYQAASVVVWSPAPEDAPADPTEAARRLRGITDRAKLPRVLADVRERMRLPASLEAIGRDLTVIASAESDLVTIAARRPTAAGAARLADTAVAALIAERIREQREAAAARAAAAQAQLDRLRLALADARTAHDRFRIEHAIADLPVERALAIEQSASLRAEAERARASALSEAARATQLSAAVRGLPEVAVLSETESRPDVRRLAEVENELAGARANLAPDHPRVTALAAEADALRARIDDPTLTVRAERIMGRNPVREFLAQGNADADARRIAAEQHARSLGELADGAAARVRELSAAEGVAADLLARVRMLEGLAAELEKAVAAATEASHRDTSDLRPLSPAVAPLHPLPSKRKLVAIALPMLVLLAAIAAVLGGALRGLRMHTPVEVAFWTRAPVAAASSWPREDAALDALAADLAGPLRHASGSTLLVGAGPAETAAAARLVERLAARHASSPGGTAVGPNVHAWDGPPSGQALRRAVRGHDRVLVLVAAGAHAVPTFLALASRLGRSTGVALVVIGLGTELAEVLDQVGDVAGFWRTSRRAPVDDAPQENP